MLQLGRRIVGQAGVDGRRLDDRAGRRHEPMESLGGPQLGDGPGGRVAGGDPLDRVEVRSGAIAANRSASRATRAPR